MRGGVDAGASAAMGGGMMSGMTGGEMHLVGPLFGIHAMGPVEHLEGRLAFLRAELAITDAQQAVWNAFAESGRKGAKEATGSPDIVKLMQPAGAPERLRMLESHLNARLSAVKAAGEARGQLYPQLSDEQKKSLDALLSPPMSGMMAAR